MDTELKRQADEALDELWYGGGQEESCDCEEDFKPAVEAYIRHLEEHLVRVEQARSQALSKIAVLERRLAKGGNA